MDTEVRDLLHDAAPEPSTPLDAERLWSQARQQRRNRRALIAFAAVVAVVAAALGITRLTDRPVQPEIVGQPEVAVPSGWTTLRVGNATFAVPGSWPVQRIAGPDGPMPCLDRLETTEYRVYLADRLYVPPCPAGRGGSEAPTGEVTVYAFQASGGEGRGSVDVDVDVLLDEAAHIAREGTPVTLPNAQGRLVESDRLRSYLFADLNAVVLIAYRPDPQLADQIAATIQPADASDPLGSPDAEDGG